jgi:hypothetical protein
MYYYRFDLDDFEQGCFTATRFSQLLFEHPGGDWVCVASNDTQALALARRAAVKEWPPTTNRGPLDFIVKFVDPVGR